MKDKKEKRIRKKRLYPAKKDKVPEVSRIKSYYGFSKEYPGIVDDKGYRDINKQGTKSEIKQKTKKLMIKSFAIVFILSFVVSYICLCISKIPVDTADIISATNIDSSQNRSYGKCYYISGQTAYSSDIDKYITEIKNLGAKSVILDAKDGAGYIYFKCDDITSVTSSAIQYSQSNYSSLIQKFTENSISVSVLFSCFADTFEASYVSSMAVTQKTDNSADTTTALWYDNSLTPHAWLNPYNNDTITYINSQLARLAEYGASEIILTNVQIPDCTNFENANFGSTVTLEQVNTKMAEFAQNTVNTYKNKCKISALTSFTGILNNSTVKNMLLTVPLDRIIVDMRLSLQPDNITIDTNTFENPSQKPYLFISNAVYSAASIIGRSEAKSDFVPLIEYSSTSDDEEKAILSHGIDSYCIYSKNSDYTN